MNANPDHAITERKFRAAINDIANARFRVQQLVEDDRIDPTLLQQLDDITTTLRLDREAYRDWHRE
jgi:hypothetical protein